MSEQRRRPFRQVDVFTTTAYAGNPVAVVLDGEGLSLEQMARFTRWTNPSEATFVLPPTLAEADYGVRIFTGASATAARAEVDRELPFAGHPTLGTCHAWLQAGGRPRQADVIVQECGAGLVPVRQSEDGLASAAPTLIRSGPVVDGLVCEIGDSLRINRDSIIDAVWADNGPGWALCCSRAPKPYSRSRPARAAVASWRSSCSSEPRVQLAEAGCGVWRFRRRGVSPEVVVEKLGRAAQPHAKRVGVAARPPGGEWTQVEARPL